MKHNRLPPFSATPQHTELNMMSVKACFSSLLLLGLLSSALAFVPRQLGTWLAACEREKRAAKEGGREGRNDHLMHDGVGNGGAVVGVLSACVYFFHASLERARQGGVC